MGSLEVMCVGLLLTAAGPAVGPPQGASGPTAEIVIPTPEPRPFVLALDEIELDWTGARRAGGKEPSAPASVPGTKVLGHERQRTRIRVEAAKTLKALDKALAETQAVNPGARGEMVVYEAGRARTEVNRQLLTSNVAVILGDGVVLKSVLARAKMARAEVTEAPGGYVIRCETPLAAIEIARELGGIEGVKHAYPLLKRTRATR
jgi:hypothetical protein